MKTASMAHSNTMINGLPESENIKMFEEWVDEQSSHGLFRGFFETTQELDTAEQDMIRAYGYDFMLYSNGENESGPYCYTVKWINVPNWNGVK